MGKHRKSAGDQTIFAAVTEGLSDTKGDGKWLCLITAMNDERETVEQQECWYFGGFGADVTDGLSHGSRRSWIGTVTEILGLEQEGDTEMTVMEDEDNTLRMTQEVSISVCI